MKNVILVVLGLIVVFGMKSKNSTINGNELLMIPIVKLESANNFINISKGMIIQDQISDELYRYNGEEWTQLKEKNSYVNKDINTSTMKINNGTVIVDDVLQLTPRTTAPSSPQDGMIYYNSMLEELYIYVSPNWVEILEQ